MTSALKSAAGAAVLLILSAHIASAGPDGACEEATTASIATESDAPAPGALTDYMKFAETASVSASATTVAASAAADTRLRDETGEAEKKQTDRLPKER